MPIFRIIGIIVLGISIGHTWRKMATHLKKDGKHICRRMVEQLKAYDNIGTRMDGNTCRRMTTQWKAHR
jgi:hypothetical protein